MPVRGHAEQDKCLKSTRDTRATRFDVIDDSCERMVILCRIIDRFGHDNGMRPIWVGSRRSIFDIRFVFDAEDRINWRDPLLYSLVGEVAEWLKAPLSKSGVRQRTAGSNPALSATNPRSRPGQGRLLDLRWFPGVHAERCESGLIGTPGKRVYRQRYRGFESRPLRQTRPERSNEVLRPINYVGMRLGCSGD